MKAKVKLRLHKITPTEKLIEQVNKAIKIDPKPWQELADQLRKTFSYENMNIPLEIIDKNFSLPETNNDKK